MRVQHMARAWFVLVIVGVALPMEADEFPMRRGGVSLRYTTERIGLRNAPVDLHVYVVPRRGKPFHRPGPVRREDIGSGSSIDDSPFYLELFATEHGKRKRINSIPFREDGDVNEMLIKWLHPRTRRGPVVMLRFEVGDDGEWKVIAFPQGIRGKARLQTIGFGGNQTYAMLWHFDLVDRRGMMPLRREYWDGRKEKVTVLHWNGKRFR